MGALHRAAEPARGVRGVLRRHDPPLRTRRAGVRGGGRLTARAADAAKLQDRLHIVSVAFPFAPVGPDAVGGAEQVLSMLDRALLERGHRSTVIACAGSRVAGTLVETPALPSRIDEEARARIQDAVRAALSEVGAAHLVHLHGLDFWAYAGASQTPSLATLHLPPSWYPPQVFSDCAQGRFLHCVSARQHASCPAGAALLPPIDNGVDVAGLGAIRVRRERYALVLGRIAPEKGQHLASQAAHAADAELLLAGAVFPYEVHEAYMAEHVAPLLDARRRWIGPVGFARKRELLAASRCLLVPSLAPETSSLVAMEAAACGTPVIAFRAGALADIVRDGETGFLVDDAAGMAAAMARAGDIDPDRCRAEAASRFDARRMVDAYLARYAALAA